MEAKSCVKRFFVALFLFIFNFGFIFGGVTKRSEAFFTERRFVLEKDVPKIDEILFVAFYDSKLKGGIDFGSLFKAEYTGKKVTKVEGLALEVAEYIARGNKEEAELRGEKVVRPLSLKFMNVTYEKEKEEESAEDIYKMGEELFEILEKYCLDVKSKKKTIKTVVYTIDDSIKYPAAFLLKEHEPLDEVYDNFIHTIIAVDSDIESTERLSNYDEKRFLGRLEKKLYNFYTKNRLTGGFFGFGRSKLVRKKRKFKNGVNVHCFYEAKTGELDDIPFEADYERFEACLRGAKTSKKIVKLISQIDKNYKLNKDLAAVVFSENKNHKQDWTPKIFINLAYEKREEVSEDIKKQLDEEELSSFGAKSDIVYEMGKVGKDCRVSENEDLEGIFYKFLEKKSGVPILGPFFIPRHREGDLLVIVRKDIAKNCKIQLGDKDYGGFDVTVGLGEYYRILKKRLGKEKILDYLIYIGDEPVIHGNVPKRHSKDEPFQFLVYGDSRKYQFAQRHKKGGTEAYELREFVRTKYRYQPFLHLLTGDLILDGGIVNEWLEFFEQILEPIAKNQWVISSIGNHDISSHTKGPGKFLGWYYDDTVPHFGNIFYFHDNATESKISVEDHVARTQGWFDFGSVRFIHLPIPTEENEKGYLEKFFTGALAKNPFTEALEKKKYVCANFDKEVYQNFEKDLEDAMKAKEKGDIDFVVVYGHAPLVTAPKYKMPHKGIFNYMIEKRSEFGLGKLSKEENDKYEFSRKINEFFKKYKVDGYFCGHNHLYDRCTWNEIPMVTIGTGTHLKTAKSFIRGVSKLKKINPDVEKEIKGNQLILGKEKNKIFVGALVCDVRKSKINCELVGMKDFGGILFDDELKEEVWSKKDLAIFDSFEIKYTK